MPNSLLDIDITEFIHLEAHDVVNEIDIKIKKISRKQNKQNIMKTRRGHLEIRLHQENDI